MSGSATEELVARIVAANEPLIAEACGSLAGPVFSVAVYDGGGALGESLAPASLWVCDEQQRAQLFADGGWEAVWEFSAYAVEQPAVSDADGGWEQLSARAAAELEEAGEFEPARAVGRAVARALNRPERLASVDKSDAFVVWRAERWPELFEDIEQTTPPARLRLLQERRLLPVAVDVLGNERWA